MLDYRTTISNVRAELYSDLISLVEKYGIENAIPLHGISKVCSSSIFINELRIEKDDADDVKSIKFVFQNENGIDEYEAIELDTDTLITVTQSIGLMLLIETYNVKLYDKKPLSEKDFNKLIKKLLNGKQSIEADINLDDFENSINLTTLDIFLPSLFGNGMEDVMSSLSDNMMNMYDEADYDEDDEDDEDNDNDISDDQDEEDEDEPIMMHVSISKVKGGYDIHYVSEATGTDFSTLATNYDIYTFMMIYDTVYQNSFNNKKENNNK